MAEEKFSLDNRKLGKVKRVIKESGMLELTTGDKIPPFPNVEVGDEIELKDKRYHVVGKGTAGAGTTGSDDEGQDIEALKKENKALKTKQAKQDARLKALEASVGEKGESIKKGEGEGDEK